MLAHGLNNTLTKIAAAAELAETMTREPAVRAELARILNLVDDAAALVRTAFAPGHLPPATPGTHK